MRNTNKELSGDIPTILTDLSLVIGKFENELQATRELLTLRNDFNPECIFRYLSIGEEELTKAHIMLFMEENNKFIKEEEAKLLLTVYGYKDKLTYPDFLNYIYPYDTEAVKTISTIHCKKYIKNEDEQPSEEVLCIFLLLLLKEFEFLHAFDEIKMEKLPLANRDSIKKWIKLLKKSAIGTATGMSSDYVFDFSEFRGILKKLKNVPERKANPICRRLSLQKECFIGIDQLEIWLKPWFKPKPEEIPLKPTQSLFDDMTASLTA